MDLRLPSDGFHALKGYWRGRYSITVSRNWRITFGWDDTDATNVDLEEDYHGR
jgi:toxin HigB-1